MPFSVVDMMILDHCWQRERSFRDVLEENFLSDFIFQHALQFQLKSLLQGANPNVCTCVCDDDFIFAIVIHVYIHVALGRDVEDNLKAQ